MTEASILRLRFKKYPRGLGKGSDAALVGAWLDVVLEQLDLSSVPVSWLFCMGHCEAKDRCVDMVNILRRGNRATCVFFRTLYHGGLWLTESEARTAIRNGWNMTEPRFSLQ